MLTPHREHIDGGKTAYDRLQQRDGIPVLRGNFVDDVMTVELKPWARMGALGSYLCLSQQQDTDAYVCEISPGGHTEPQRHIFEETIYIVKGQGSTVIWQEDGSRLTFEWGEGTIFAIPLNAAYQHFNSSGLEPVRFFAGTTCPHILNIFRNEDFVFRNPFRFTDRFEPSDEFLSFNAQSSARNWETNLIQHVNKFELDAFPMKGAGVKHMRFTLADSGYGCHISEYPPGARSTFHRHAAGAVILITEGEGYVSLWRDGETPAEHDFKTGSIYCPEELMWHAHFNTGHGVMRHFAVRGPSPKYTYDRFRNPLYQMMPLADEPPEIHQRYLCELARKGVTADVAVVKD